MASSPSPETSTVRSRPDTGVLITLGVAALVFVWAYWRSMALVTDRWYNEPDYVQGFLVIPFAALLLWLRSDLAPGWKLEGNYWGLALLAVGAWMRWFSAYYNYVLVDPLSLVPSIAGVVLFIGGWRAFRWALPAIVFLIFMVPLPGELADRMTHPLQAVGANVSTYLLQTMGVFAWAEGNVIHLSRGNPLNVAEACSGLKMTMLFFAICYGAAFVEKRPLLDRVVIIASAFPIAMIANIMRITLTGLLHELFNPETADNFYHSLAGWFMMPVAIVLLWIILAVWSRLLITVDENRPVAIGLPVSPRPQSPDQGRRDPRP
jgi:exosortase